MDLSNVHKKPREAGFFLDAMWHEEQRIVGYKEPFDFYLSAFLSAGRTVDYRLRHEQGTLYRPWRKAWDKKLPTKARGLIEDLIIDRNIEVHENGSSRNVGHEDIPLGYGEYRFSDGSKIEISGTPSPLSGDNTPPASVRRRTYSFTIAGVERKATDACRDYLDLLNRMVAQFEADHS